VNLAGFFGWPTRLNGSGRSSPSRAARKAIALCTNLLSERGEVSGTLLASEALAAYHALDEHSRAGFFDLLVQQFSPDPEQVGQAGDAYRANPSTQSLARLQAAVESPRQELFRRLNLASAGTRTLVELRGRLLRELHENPHWMPIVDDLERLLIAWFNRGFLELRRIDWRTSALVLEKLIRYEAVHQIQGWNDLRRRLEADRRCYGFFHPALPGDPSSSSKRRSPAA
jgi:Malonyl-CoA decarboxylase (MCD).